MERLCQFREWHAEQTQRCHRVAATATSANVERNRAARTILVLAGTDSAHGGTVLLVILRSQNIARVCSFHDADDGTDILLLDVARLR